jgi:hypothetical protein
MVDAFLEVYHVRAVHPDNAALLYDDQTVTVSMLANGHSRLTTRPCALHGWRARATGGSPS